MIINNLIQAKETNEDWNNCLDENSLVMGRCVYACNGDRVKPIAMINFENANSNALVKYL